MSKPYIKGVLSRERGNTVDIESKIKKSSLKWLHVFPDYYKIGMLNNGFQMAYFMLNSQEDIFCERSFVQEEAPYVSLETQTLPKDFDVVSFSIPFEMLYSNVLKFLDKGGIEPLANYRGKPILIAGGNAPITNPEPMSDFFDAMVVGELEPTIENISSKLLNFSKKSDRLQELSKLEGVYVPSLYEPVYSNHHQISLRPINGAPEKIRMAANPDIEFNTDFIVSPDTLWPDFYFTEINRGCLYNCKFCMLGEIYPNRFRSYEKVMDIAERARKLTDKMRLVSSTEDTHPQISEILGGMKSMGFEIVVGSQRADWVNDTFTDYIDNKSFTIAPEAGSDRLRKFIGKSITNNDIMQSVKTVSKNRIEELQLYLIVGLPGETEEDVKSLSSLIRNVRYEMDKSGKKDMKLKAAINCFIPKPHTSFEHQKQLTYGDYEKLTEQVKGSVGIIKGVEYSLMDEKSILVQGIVTRGDRRVGRVIYEAYKNGDMVDSWSGAFYKSGLRNEDSFGERGFLSFLPWSMVELGKGLSFGVKKVSYANRKLNITRESS